MVITMIGQVADELEVVLGAGGVLEGAHPGLTLIDTSTVGIAASKKMAEAARARGVAFLDATVSGSVGPAKEGKLTFMVGGERADAGVGGARASGNGRKGVPRRPQWGGQRHEGDRQPDDRHDRSDRG